MTENILAKMLVLQNDAQLQRGNDLAAMNKADRTDYIRKHAMYLVAEVGEFLHEVPGFKDWKIYPEEMAFCNTKALEELSDVLHFFLNICLALGLSAEDIYNIYCNKAYINMARLRDTSNYKKDTEVHNE